MKKRLSFCVPAMPKGENLSPGRKFLITSGNFNLSLSKNAVKFPWLDKFRICVEGLLLNVIRVFISET
jgi:hypothetical protein